jgi:hypothetical protein
MAAHAAAIMAARRHYDEAEAADDEATGDGETTNAFPKTYRTYSW